MPRGKTPEELSRIGKLGGRPAKSPEEKCRPMSVYLTPGARATLEALAAKLDTTPSSALNHLLAATTAEELQERINA